MVDLVNPKLKNCCACGSSVALVGGDPLNSAGSSKGGPIYAPRGPSGTQNIRIIELNNDQQLWLKSKWWIFERFVCLLPYKVIKHIQTYPKSPNEDFVWQGSAPSGPWWLPDHTQRAKAAEAARAETGNPEVEDLGNGKYTDYDYISFTDWSELCSAGFKFLERLPCSNQGLRRKVFQVFEQGIRR